LGQKPAIPPVEVRIIPTYAVMADFGLINRFNGLWIPLIASATATLGDAQQ
jgi:sn-glycerol 3-phosphate transport system permease protein